MVKGARLAFGKGWNDWPKLSPTDAPDWKVLPVWKRLLDPRMRTELEQLLRHGGSRRAAKALMQSLHKRESHRQMKKLIDSIVDSGMVNVPDRAGCYNTILTNEGSESILLDILKATPELQFCITKWWENLTELPTQEETASATGQQPLVGITKEPYVWCVARILYFLLLHTEQYKPHLEKSVRFNTVERLKAVGELDWQVDSRCKRVVQYPAFCDMLFDLSSLWCDVDVTNNVSDRVEFLNVIYDHVFFDRLPVWTPTLVRQRIEWRIMARAAPIDNVVLYDSTPLPAAVPQRSPKSPESPERPSRRYENILNLISYQEPPSFDNHNLYPSFPYRKIRYPDPLKLKKSPFEALAALDGVVPLEPPKQHRLPSYSKTLASVVPVPEKEKDSTSARSSTQASQQHRSRGQVANLLGPSNVAGLQPKEGARPVHAVQPALRRSPIPAPEPKPAVVEKPAQQQQVQLLLVDNEGQPKRRLAITHGVTNIHHLLKHLGAESGKVLKCVMMDGNVVECMTQEALEQISVQYLDEECQEVLVLKFEEAGA